MSFVSISMKKRFSAPAETSEESTVIGRILPDIRPFRGRLVKKFGRPRLHASGRGNGPRPRSVGVAFAGWLAVCDRPHVEVEDCCAPSPARPIAIDLFAGAGGMSLGFEQAGFDVVAAVEYDPVHAATHAYNFPASEVLCRDVASLDAATALAAARRGHERMYPGVEWPGHIDAIIGGPPCQGFSTGGKREDGDDRNRLLLAFVSLVESLKPKVLCLENVVGLLETRFDDVREEAFRRLTRAGYELSGTTEPVDCVSFGVPQRRRRVVVLGRLGGPAPGRPQPVPTRLSVRDALDGLPSPSSYPALRSSDVAMLTPEDADGRVRTTSTYARRLAGLDSIPGDCGFDRRVDHATITGARFTVHTETTVKRFAETAQGSVEPKSRLYRLPLSGPSRTLRPGRGPSVDLTPRHGLSIRPKPGDHCPRSCPFAWLPGLVPLPHHQLARSSPGWEQRPATGGPSSGRGFGGRPRPRASFARPLLRRSR